MSSGLSDDAELLLGGLEQVLGFHWAAQVMLQGRSDELVAEFWKRVSMARQSDYSNHSRAEHSYAAVRTISKLADAQQAVKRREEFSGDTVVPFLSNLDHELRSFEELSHKIVADSYESLYGDLAEIATEPEPYDLFVMMVRSPTFFDVPVPDYYMAVRRFILRELDVVSDRTMRIWAGNLIEAGREVDANAEQLWKLLPQRAKREIDSFEFDFKVRFDTVLPQSAAVAAYFFTGVLPGLTTEREYSSLGERRL